MKYVVSKFNDDGSIYPVYECEDEEEAMKTAYACNGVYEKVSPSLTDDQQEVLDYLKKMCPPKLGVSAMVTVYCLADDNINDNWQEYSDEIPEHIEALQKLSISEENQVLAAFAEWGSKEGNQ